MPQNTESNIYSLSSILDSIPLTISLKLLIFRLFCKIMYITTAIRMTARTANKATTPDKTFDFSDSFVLSGNSMSDGDLEIQPFYDKRIQN